MKQSVFCAQRNAAPHSATKEACHARFESTCFSEIKIYFRNAMRIYPHVAEALTQLGYFGEEGAKEAARR